MFTGLVEARAPVVDVSRDESAARLSIAVPAEWNSQSGSEIGASVAINGCCLTLIENSAERWSFEAGPETLSRTNLGGLKRNDWVNLERPLAANGRLGGHFVQGHIDGVGTVAHILRDDWAEMGFEVPPELARLMVPKGSVAVDGVSLTLVDVEHGRFSVALIPHTLEFTTLGSRMIGDEVNIETDLLGKFVEKLLQK